MKKGIGFFNKCKNWRFLISLPIALIILIVAGIPHWIVVTAAEANRDFSYWIWKKIDNSRKMPDWFVRWDRWISDNDAVKQSEEAETNQDY